MSPDRSTPFECAAVGCGAIKRQVNRWLVVLTDESGAHIYKWDMCPPEAMENGQHFCGLDHAFRYVSNAITPDTTKVNRESTLELKPPITRDGTITS